MTKVEIRYNPFLLETSIEVDGVELDVENSRLPCGNGVRLQEWVDDLFDELSDTCNTKRFDISFHGLETDYLDIEEAAEKAKENGFEVKLSWQTQGAASIDERLEKVMEVFSELREDARFANVLSDSNVEQEFKLAFEEGFDVYVVATMSSGKSTLINAMLGTNILPALNEATTATIARIVDNDAMQGQGFNAICRGKDGEVLAEKQRVELATIAEWNESKDTALIEIEGDIVGVRQRERARLVLTDTPGPNNSQDSDHKAVTFRAIEDSTKRPIILYILNSHQLRTNDDNTILGEISRIIRGGGKSARDRFIFILNKADAFNQSNEKERISAVLARVNSYLEDKGIERPIVFPVSSEFARLLRSDLRCLDETDQDKLFFFERLFGRQESLDMTQYVKVNSKVQVELERRNLPPLLLKSGLPMVEAVIDDYVDRYALPMRVNHASEAFKGVLEKIEGKLALNEALEAAMDNQESLEAELQLLEDKKERGFDAEKYKQSLEDGRDDIDVNILEELRDARMRSEKYLPEVGKRFKGEVPPEVAASKLEEAERELQGYYEISVARYEDLFNRSQDFIKKELEKGYRDYVESVFEGIEKINFDVMEGVKNTIQAFDVNLKLSSGDLESKEVVVDSYTVSVSKWYKPWTWGKKERVEVKESIEYVDLSNAWSARAAEITEVWTVMGRDAQRHIWKGRGRQIDHMLAFMDTEFSRLFDGLLQEIREKIQDKEKLAEDIRQLGEQKATLDGFSQRLDEVLKI